jgi:hypothetical protein
VNNAPTTEQVRSPRLSSQSSTRISSDTNNNASRGGYRRGSSDVTSPKGSMESSSGEVWRVMSNNPALSSRDGVSIAPCHAMQGWYGAGCIGYFTWYTHTLPMCT